MRVSFTVAAGLALAAALAVPCAFAQAITFPAPAFRGGNTDWRVVLTTNADASVVYALTVPEAKKPLNGPLDQTAAPQGQYQLVGVIGQEKTGLKVQIAPVKLGQVCKDNKGNTGGKYGRYTYAIMVTPAAKNAGPDHKAWPALWYGCGNFTLD
ncbi:hypothetical protein [Lysobacter sp. TAB13]|uniref:hypothetical protein n=1 Tax=Lysobacter sp. TAB13 TaxID=3233065 RepID=UPI003F98AE59